MQDDNRRRVIRDYPRRGVNVEFLYVDEPRTRANNTKFKAVLPSALYEEAQLVYIAGEFNKFRHDVENEIAEEEKKWESLKMAGKLLKEKESANVQ